jgi:hypothetical protein
MIKESCLERFLNPSIRSKNISTEDNNELFLTSKILLKIYDKSGLKVKIW